MTFYRSIKVDDGFKWLQVFFRVSDFSMFNTLYKLYVDVCVRCAVCVYRKTRSKFIAQLLVIIIYTEE